MDENREFLENTNPESTENETQQTAENPETEVSDVAESPAEEVGAAESPAEEGGAAESPREEPLQPQNPTAEETRPQLQDSLEDILCQISGAGKVKVLLAQAAGESTIYQTDEDISTGENSSDIRRETVLVTSSDRKEVGLVKQVNPPIYQGAIVLCQGADNAAIRLSVVEAVMSVTGLTSDRITVLKMK